MELREVEMRLGVQFPKLFHAISSSGMMDYLIHSKKWVEDKIAKDKNYVWKGNFFGEYMGDCRLLAFESIPSAYEELYQCLELDLGISPERRSMDPRYKLVPFGRKISGDPYCFLYERGKDEPKIVVYGHDTGDVDWWASNFEKFVYFQIVEEAAEGKREIHSHDMKAHIQWLSVAHKRALEEMPVGDILERLPGTEGFNIWL